VLGGDFDLIAASRAFQASVHEAGSA